MTARSFATTLTALLALVAMPVAAQDIDPETGEVYIPPEQQEPAQTQEQSSGDTPWYAGGPTGQAQPAEQPPAHAEEERPPASGGDDSYSSGSSTESTSTGNPSGRDDHMTVIDQLGFGFVGINQVPIGGNSGGGLSVDQISAPTLGIRYWFNETVGLDVGIGIGYVGGSVSSGMTSIPADDAFAMTIHGGVPIALFHDGHFTFEVIPEMNLGFATGTAYGAVSTEDRGRDGLLFSLGARAGAEIQFGFMGIPNLSLMATVGLMFQYSSAGLGSNQSGTVQGASANGFSFGTSLDGEPWDIFLGSLTAFYYFG